MKVSLSILSVKENIEKIKELENLPIDFMHLDVMDGKFVPNQTDLTTLSFIEKKKDIHLMVEDVIKYVDLYVPMHPDYLTFHVEVGNTERYISYIKSKGIQVGLSLCPSTPVEEIIPYLKDIDMVLVMSVEPGYGGQKFLESARDKIEVLSSLKDAYDFLIEVDGGINKETAKFCRKADILVIGSAITEALDPSNAFYEIEKNL